MPNSDKASICLLAKIEAANPREFAPSPLSWFYEYTRDAINNGLGNLPKLLPKSASFSAEPFEAIFGKFCPNHSFNAIKLDWNIRLTEPQITRTLAHLLNMGWADLRARRLHAFLSALGVHDLPNAEQLCAALVTAEDDHIDLEIRWPIEGSKKYKPIVVEAKFGHKITQGQLKSYKNLRSKPPYDQPDFFLLALNEKAKIGLRGQQHKIWTFVAWRDLWLRFEKLRPAEDNPSLSIFLNTLWARIGGLNYRHDT